MLLSFNRNSRNTHHRRGRHILASNSETQLDSLPEELSTDALPPYTISDFNPPPNYIEVSAVYSLSSNEVY